jgi:colanic acid/amylovoran biosynthesis glycosyltransferase
VDVDTFAPAANTRRDGALRILGVGRLVEKKGFDVLVRAIAALGEDAPRIECTIVGSGRERERLESLIRALKVEDRVQLAGEKENGEVRSLMRASDLFVLPCRIDPGGDRDGIPVVLMEAMACGVCAVSGDLPAIGELISDEKTGVLVKGDSVESLAVALRRLIGNAQLRQRLGEAGRQRVIEEFSLGVNVQRLLAAFANGMTWNVWESGVPDVRTAEAVGADEAISSGSVPQSFASNSAGQR